MGESKVLKLLMEKKLLNIGLTMTKNSTRAMWKAAIKSWLTVIQSERRPTVKSNGSLPLTAA